MYAIEMQIVRNKCGFYTSVTEPQIAACVCYSFVSCCYFGQSSAWNWYLFFLYFFIMYTPLPDTMKFL